MTTQVDLTGLSADQTVNDLCYEILRRAGEPMHYLESILDCRQGVDIFPSLLKGGRQIHVRFRQ